MKKSFDIPTLIGFLHTKSDNKSALNARSPNFKKNVRRIGLEIDERHLRNTVDSIKLVGLSGLIVCDGLQKKISKFIPELHPIAKRSNTVDIVTQGRGKVVGYDARGMILLNWINKNSKRTTRKTAAIVGRHNFTRSFKGGLSCEGWSINEDPSPSLIIVGELAGRQIDKLDRMISKNPVLLLNLSGQSFGKGLKDVRVLKHRQFMKLYNSTTATLLTSTK